MNLIELHHINKSYYSKPVLEDFSMDVKEGEFLVIRGKSGSGKSTLLNIMGLLDKPNSGDVIILGEKNVKPFSSKSRKLLASSISYLFQNFALLEDKSVEFNLGLAMDKPRSKESKAKMEEALNTVGLSGYQKKKVAECSGGEQQRIAMARLLLKPCKLFLADEPTGSLDPDNKHVIFHLLKELQQMGKTVVIVTHDPELAEIADRVIDLNEITANKKEETEQSI